MIYQQNNIVYHRHKHIINLNIILIKRLISTNQLLIQILSNLQNHQIQYITIRLIKYVQNIVSNLQSKILNIFHQCLSI